jgi:hypothetical protein
MIFSMTVSFTAASTRHGSLYTNGFSASVVVPCTYP